ncbi:MAG: TetR/AcrR family transcriptional regulator [Solirubrobacteraceae bacterium]|jgi:AcrR family transcriptional regulator
MSAAPAIRRPGRPRATDTPVSVDAMLAAALRAFATHGYDGVSVNAISRELGVSHNLLHQRFGSKDGLWHAAVDWGFGDMARELASAFDPTLTDPLEQMRLVLRRFLAVSAGRPELLGLMNIEGRSDSGRLDYLYDKYVEPMTAPIARLLDHLAAAGRIRPTSMRTLHFLVAHGAAAPYTLLPLARHFEPSDRLDPATISADADLVIDIIITGLQLPPSDAVA